MTWSPPIARTTGSSAVKAGISSMEIGAPMTSGETKAAIGSTAIEAATCSGLRQR